MPYQVHAISVSDTLDNICRNCIANEQNIYYAVVWSYSFWLFTQLNPHAWPYSEKHIYRNPVHIVPGYDLMSKLRREIELCSGSCMFALRCYIVCIEFISSRILDIDAHVAKCTWKLALTRRLAWTYQLLYHVLISHVGYTKPKWYK